MKNKIIFSILALTSSLGYSQVIIGDEKGTATDKTSVLLEFSKTESKGIVLPYNTTLPSTPSEGTIILDATDSANAQVKYYNGAWQTLSQDGGDITTELTAQPKVTSQVSKEAVIIGAETTTVEGVLVLESKNKAMVLPTVASTNEIINPAPGMMAYVSNATDKLLAVYNGANWSFWSATK